MAMVWCSMQRAPTFTSLTRRECLALLRRHRAGRLAFSFRDRVDIEPIGYLFHDGWLYGRTSPGTKLTMMRRNPWVAFEVDEIEGRFDWRSVVAHGTVYFLNPDGEEHPAFAEALALFRSDDPTAFAANDPAPERTATFRIHLAELTGRQAVSGVRSRPQAG
jgi:uncharacterized protein